MEIIQPLVSARFLPIDNRNSVAKLFLKTISVCLETFSRSKWGHSGRETGKGIKCCNYIGDLTYDIFLGKPQQLLIKTEQEGHVDQIIVHCVTLCLSRWKLDGSPMKYNNTDKVL